MSSLFCFMDLMWRYHGAKGVPEYKVEDGSLTIWRPPWTWRRVLRTTSSNHEILMIPSCDETCPPVDLEIRDVGSPKLLAEPCLIRLVGSLAIS